MCTVVNMQVKILNHYSTIQAIELLKQIRNTM